jgi:hypothetical protein
MLAEVKNITFTLVSPLCTMAPLATSRVRIIAQGPQITAPLRDIFD